jgi:hypothetical protein
VRAVARTHEARGGEIGSRIALAARFAARPDEQRDESAAVADRRLGDDDRNGQETRCALEEAARVELAVLRIDEVGGERPPPLAQRRGDVVGGGRAGERRDQRGDGAACGDTHGTVARRDAPRRITSS